MHILLPFLQQTDALCPITRPIDTLVLGGGMAGTFAALAAKTPDTTVAIVEPANVLGGQGTAGGVAGFCGDSQRVNAPFAHLVETLAQHELIAEYDPLADRRAYDLELCAFFLQEMVCLSRRRNPLPRPSFDGTTRRWAHRLGRGHLRL